jgi:hypothetical protein
MPKIYLKSFLQWIPAADELPKRDVPVIVAVTAGKQRFTAVSHRMSRGWSGLTSSASVTQWAHLPTPPLDPNET